MNTLKTLRTLAGGGPYRAAFWLLMAAWLAVALMFAERQVTWLDETNYIVKSWWYVSGAVTPYGSEDATWYMPLYFLFLGLWQKIAGHDLFAIRLSSVAIGFGNIVLILALFQRMGIDRLIGIAAAGLFALPVYGLTYATAAAPYALSNFITLLLLHTTLSLQSRFSVSLAAAFAAQVTALYFLRPNLIVISGPLFLLAAWYCRGRFLLFGSVVLTIFLATWGALSAALGGKFTYFSMRLPILSDILMSAGVIPSLYPYIETFPVWVQSSDPASMGGLLSSALDPERLWLRFLMPHTIPIAAAVVSAMLSLRNGVRTAWVPVLLTIYVLGIASHLLASQLYCQNCIQPYANYFNLLPIVALAQVLTDCLRREGIEDAGQLIVRRLGARARFVTVVGPLVLPLLHGMAVAGSGSFMSRSTFNWAIPSAASMVRAEVAAFYGVIPQNSRVGIIAGHATRVLALNSLDVRFHPTSINPGDSYFKLRDGLSEGDAVAARKELEDFTLWTDATMQRWLESDFDILLVEEMKKYSSIIPWTPDNPVVAGLIATHFAMTRKVEVPFGSRKKVVRVYERKR